MPKNDDANWGQLAAMGMEIAVGVGLGAVVGTWIDRRKHTDPWGVLIGVALGLTAGTYLMIKAASKANKD